MEAEVCGECRFVPADWTTNDAARTLHPLGPWWREVTAGVETPGDALLDVADHSGAALHTLGERLLAALGVELTGPAPEPGPAGPPPSDPALAERIAAIDDRARRIVGAVAGASAAAWQGASDARAALLELVHVTTHALRHAGRLVHAAGGGAPHAVGTVAAVNISEGGVPKLPVAEAL